jgi:hypothetical protein
MMHNIFIFIFSFKNIDKVSICLNIFLCLKSLCFLKNVLLVQFLQLIDYFIIIKSYN